MGVRFTEITSGGVTFYNGFTRGFEYHIAAVEIPLMDEIGEWCRDHFGENDPRNGAWYCEPMYGQHHLRGTLWMGENQAMEFKLRWV